jgi:acetyl esterase/lipase
MIPEHFLRVPTTKTVSPEMQQVIAFPAADWFLRKPQNRAQWDAVIRDYDHDNAQQSQLLCQSLKVKTEPVTIATVPCYRVTPAEIAPGHEQRLLVHTHGGAYVFGAGESGLAEAALIAHYSKSPVLSVDYRMPPKHPPFPAAIEDVVAVWRELIESHNPANAAMFGSSAGGGLTMAVTLALKDQRIPLPAALFLGSPWARIDKIADSQFANDTTDNLLITYDGLLGLAAKLYAHDNRLDDPLLSPLEGDLSGFPPSIIITGTRDLFLSLAAFAHRKLRRSGVDAELHVFEAVSHIQFLFFIPDGSGGVAPVPECVEAMTEVARFFDRHLTS